MEAKRIEISTLLRTGLKIEISKQLNVSRMSVHQVEQCLKGSESLKDDPRLGRTQIISQEAFKKDFESNSCRKMTKLAQKMNTSVSIVSRMVKKMGGKSLRRSRIALLNAAMIQAPLFLEWRKELRESNPHIVPMRKVSPLILSPTNRMIGS